MQLARDICTRLSESSCAWLGHWAPARVEYLQNLASACDRLKRAAPANLREFPNFDLAVLEWIPDVHPWLPTVA